MAKHKYKNKNKNKSYNNSPAVEPKANFSNVEETVELKKELEKKAEKKKLKVSAKVKKVIMAAILVAVLAIIVLLIINLVDSKVPETAVPEYLGQNATSSVAINITVDEDTQLERYNEVKRKIKGDTRAFKFYSRPEIEIDEKYLEGDIYFSNLTMNDCTMIVTIIDKDDNVIFRSTGIETGKCMQRIGLSKAMNYGEHKVRMYVTGYDNETFEVVGTQYMNLTLHVGSEYNASK